MCVFISNCCQRSSFASYRTASWCAKQIAYSVFVWRWSLARELTYYSLGPFIPLAPSIINPITPSVVTRPPKAKRNLHVTPLRFLQCTPTTLRAADDNQNCMLLPSRTVSLFLFFWRHIPFKYITFCLYCVSVNRPYLGDDFTHIAVRGVKTRKAAVDRK